VTDRNSPNENESEKISPSKRGASGRCTTTERPLTTKANAKDATTPFPRKSLKRVASIAAEFPPMKVAGMPLKFDRDSGAVTSRMVSPIKLKIRKFLRTSAGPSIAPTIVRLNEWLASIQARTLEKPIARRLANRDPIERIAEGLIANACGTERGSYRSHCGKRCTNLWVLTRTSRETSSQRDYRDISFAGVRQLSSGSFCRCFFSISFCLRPASLFVVWPGIYEILKET